MTGFDDTITTIQQIPNEAARVALDGLDTSLGNAADELNSILNQPMSAHAAATIGECIKQLDNLRIKEIVSLRTFLNKHKQEDNS